MSETIEKRSKMPQEHRRICVVGISGAGKSTVARQLSQKLGLPYFEMDALYHGPNWQPRPDFEQRVHELIAGDEWITDSTGYPTVQDALWKRATFVIWLDPPRWTVFRQLFLRSLRYSATGHELWNGNKEPWHGWLKKDHPLYHAMRQYRARQDAIALLLKENPQLAYIRFNRTIELISYK